MSLTGKVFIITGGSKGIGKAVVKKVVSEGARVVINYNSDKQAADELVTELGGADKAVAIQADASKISEVEKIVSTAVERFGKIDVVMPNAGMMSMIDLEHVTEANFDKIFELNVKGPLFLVQKSVPHMPRGGRVIFVSTGVTTLTSIMPPYLLYAATKAAIEQFTRVLAKDLGKTKGINVNCVAPGPVGTDLFYEGKSQQLLGMIGNQSPFGRVGTPEEIAGVVAFLSGDESSWVSGQVWRVNGGNMV
ncbi:hypothetical protein V8F06_008502 [Rhypophila decipiens]